MREKRMLKWSEGMEPRFISWNVAAMHTLTSHFLIFGAGRRSKRHLPGSQRVWNDVYAPADDLSRLNW